MATAFAALIFSGPLAGYVSRGISFVLFGAFIIGVWSALTSSYAGTVARPHEIPAAILALIASIVAVSIPPLPSGEKAFINVIAIIIITSLSTGVLFLVLGYLRAGSLIRFIPYPVIGGFLAGTGLLLIKGAFGVMTGKPLALENFFFLIQTDVLMKWLPGLLLALILFLVLRWRNHYLVMPAWLVISMGLFYSILFVTDIPLDAARDHGWLVGPFQKVGLTRPLALSSVAEVDWAVILSQTNRIATILIISCISLLLNASGLELVVREEIDLNKELRSVGFANLLAGLGGGTVGIHSLSLSALGYTMGAKSRIIGLFSAAICGSVLLFGGSALSYFPRPIMGSVLLFLGLSFLHQWLYESWSRLPKIDCVLIFLILAVIGVFGFLEGVAAGLFVAVVIFVVRYSHVSVIKHTFSGSNYHSSVDRTQEERHLLTEKGKSLHILKLQGFIFFGTGHNLFEEILKRGSDKTQETMSCILLDFRFVTGVDSSAVNSFAKMRQYAETQSCVLIFTHLSSVVMKQLVQRGFNVKEDDHFHIFVDIDCGVEWWEDRILAGDRVNPGEERRFLEDELKDFLPSSSEGGSIMGYLERREVPGGYYLMHQGDPPHSLYFLESGRVTVRLESGDEVIRLRTMGPGSIVGELGLYLRLSSTASAVTEKPSVLYRLSEEALRRLEENEPAMASAFHRFIVHRLGERLVNTNESLRGLMD
jgi:SulP family sulfate permease